MVGAGGAVGADAVAKAAPDGYTLLADPSSLHGITPFLYSKLTYDPNKDLAPVIALASLANVLVVNTDVKANSVAELIALIRANPGKFSFASSGSGSTIHMSGEMFRSMLKLDIAHVPYKGSAPAVTDLIGGRIEAIIDALGVGVPHVKSGKLKLLAVTAAERLADYPDVPTVRESGVPDYVGVLALAKEKFANRNAA